MVQAGKPINVKEMRPVSLRRGPFYPEEIGGSHGVAEHVTGISLPRSARAKTSFSF
jgi:hypothetical protein